MKQFVQQAPISRRHLLGLTSGLGLAAALTGCQVQTKSDPEPNTGASADAGKIKFQDPKAELPTKEVTYRAMMSGGIKAPFFEAVWKAFEQAHDNVTMQLDATNWKRINEVIPLGIRNKTAPDMFQMPNNVPVQVAVNEGWLAPLDDIIPDFDEWKGQFPDTAFIPGVHVFNDKTYSWTFTSSRSQYGHLLYFDSALMAAADHDPVQDRMTWDSLREVTKKITKAGKGKNYGLVIGGEKLGSVALNLAELAGLPGGDMNFTTGEYNYTDPLVQEAIELLLAIKADGSMFPGFLSLTQADADAQFPQGNVGITFDGAWNVSNWMTEAADFDYGVAMPPTPNNKEVHHVGFEEGTAAPLFAYKDSPLLGVTGELFRYMGSVEGQAMMVKLTNGIFTSEIEEANEQAKGSSLVSGHAKEAGEIMSKLRVTQPLPQVGNPDVAKVILEQKAVKPSFADVVEGIFSGQVKDTAKSLKDLRDRSDKSLDDAIAAAKKKGAQVSREDWVFPNWDREKDYTLDDYSAR